MTKWARIENNTVMEITNIDPTGRFHSDLVWVVCPEEVEQHWSYLGEEFSAPLPPE